MFGFTYGLMLACVTQVNWKTKFRNYQLKIKENITNGEVCLNEILSTNLQGGRCIIYPIKAFLTRTTDL